MINTVLSAEIKANVLAFVYLFFITVEAIFFFNTGNFTLLLILSGISYALRNMIPEVSSSFILFIMASIMVTQVGILIPHAHVEFLRT